MRLVALIARREFTSRVSDRAFFVSTAISVLIIAAVAVLPGLLGLDEAETYRVGAVGERSQAMARAAAARAGSFDVAVSPTRVGDAATARSRLASGELDAVVLDGRELVFEADPPPMLLQVLQLGARELRVAESLRGAGLEGARAQAALNPPPLATRSLDGSRSGDAGRSGIAFIVVVILYGQLITYCYWVSSGVVEEKASRVVELLISSVRPSRLLAGKIIGLGLLGLTQLTAIGGLGLAASVWGGGLELPDGLWEIFGLALAWFVLGYAFYACLFAVAGALVSRQEELQNTMAPLTMVILVSFFLAFSGINDPDGTLARVSSFIPPVAPMIMPPRMVGAELPAWEVALSVAVMLVTTAALVPLAARLYSGAILRTGARVKLRDAFTGARG